MKWWENIGNMMGFAGIWENFPSIFKYLFEWKWWFPVSSWIFHRQIHLYISINLTMFHSYIKILLTVLVCVISPKYWIKLCELSHLATGKTFRMGTRIAKFLGFKLYDRAATVCRAVLPSGPLAPVARRWPRCPPPESFFIQIGEPRAVRSMHALATLRLLMLAATRCWSSIQHPNVLILHPSLHIVFYFIFCDYHAMLCYTTFYYILLYCTLGVPDYSLFTLLYRICDSSGGEHV